MKSEGRYRDKFLDTLWLLKTHTNEDNPLSTQEIITLLKDRGVAIDRRTLKKEIDMMNERGFNIAIVKKSHQYAYYVPEDCFNEEDLNILISAIRAASFITKEKTSNLVKKLTQMAKDRGLDVTDSDVVCYNVIKQNTLELFGNIITFQKCIDKQKQVSFFYFHLNEKVEREYSKNKQRYLVDPVSVVYNEGFYYLVAYNRNQKIIKTYRVDRCEDIHIEATNVNNRNAKEFLDEYLPVVRGVKQDAELKDIVSMYTKQAFKMYGGSPHNISLQFPKNLLAPVYDKFSAYDELGKKYKIS